MMKRAPKIPLPPKIVKRPSVSTTLVRHPTTGRFTKTGVGTPQNIPYMPTSTLGGSK
jgi:hypothetical protein